MYGTLVDVQLEGIQKNIEDYLSAGRQSTCVPIEFDRKETRCHSYEEWCCWRSTNL